MKQLGILLAILVGVIFLAYWSSKPGNLESLFMRAGVPIANQQTSPTPQEKIITVGSSAFKVEIANTEQSRRLGLSEHTNLPEDTGMLFVLEKQDEQPSLWMKGMKFPVDIIWINDRVVSEITPNVPIVPTGLTDAQTPKYAPRTKVDYVLEIAGGVAAKRGIKVGDTIVLPPLK
ncbi:MAG: DUF192 domain-containing protein [Patescibacteria group bacterium]